MLRIYLDTCCLNRLFDEPAQERVLREAEAVVFVLNRVEAGEWQWIASEALSAEIQQTQDLERRARANLLIGRAWQSVLVDQSRVERARELRSLGFRAFDALHLACAEGAGVDLFLTTDDRLIRRAARAADRLRVRVANPLTWVREVDRE
jgi:predicted nucleic acid-binding protein